MKHLFRLIERVGEYAERSAREREEAYLAQAVDHHDLERRMRELDRTSAPPNWLLPRV
jgi:hypothetical protein